jgi:hypothetical protein
MNNVETLHCCEELYETDLDAVTGGDKPSGIYAAINRYSQTLQSQDKLGNTQIQTP